MRLAALMVLLAVGVLGAALGILVELTPERRTVKLLELGQVYTAPDRVPFVGDLVVYGTPPDGRRPELAELGCRVSPGGGPLSTKAAAREPHIVVDGRGLVPLMSFRGSEGDAMGCAGRAAQAASPLYVIAGSNDRSLVPLAGYSLAALCIPMAVFSIAGPFGQARSAARMPHRDANFATERSPLQSAAR